ncbi:hypothetical protein BC351_04710 [Paenibacillus ferrarius]|uniref:EamA domain-containing protein n=1 Tax=Paenibacillus ferrarius TaxID=1469647 RepID=A0A1V4HLP9_9BACL|nr:DMT family transporter [Paenibacillus ferrarius]OPH57806.1 hypothetical protein BC351_04710 [Paenibacillus ferrarius]
MTRKKSAFIGLFAVALIWGITYVLSAYLLKAFSPILLSFLRICMTGAWLAAFMNAQAIQHPSRKEWGLLIGSAIFFTLIQQPLYFIGLQLSTAANASLIYAVAPLATLILEVIFLKSKLHWSKMAGALIGFSGVLVIVIFSGQSLGLSIGDLYLIIAMLGLSISILFTPSLSKRMSPFSISLYSTLIGSILMVPMAAGERLIGVMEIHGSFFTWMLLLISGLLNVLAGLWWIRGIAEVGPGTAALFNNLPPFIAIIASYLFLGDAVYFTQLAGGVLIVAGVFISNHDLFKRVHGQSGLDIN